MISVSSEFKQLMRLRTYFTEEAVITFADERTLTLTKDDFTITNNHVEDCAGASSIPLGSALQKTIQIEIANFDDRFEDYDFFGAVIVLKCKYQLSNSIETVNYGRYTVTSPETYGSTVIVTASDDMYKTNGRFTTGLTFPVTAGTLLNDICTSCGISLGTSTFRNRTFTIDALPEQELTFRQVIGYIAMIAAGNARFDYNGYLEIKEYNWPLSSSANLQTLDMWCGKLSVSTDDIVITGLKIKVNDTEIIQGQEGYCLTVENPLAAGKESTFLQTVGATMIGASFRQFEGEHTGYPIAEFMDPVIIVDQKENEYYSFLTDIQFNFCGSTSFKNSAEPPLRNSSQYTSAASRAYIEARKLVAQEKTARELAIQQLGIVISNSSGLYTTTVTQPDNSKIFYLHDKPTLAESSIVWMMTAEAWGVSTDGGQTWNAGMTVDGDVIARILTADGVNADWLNAGTFVVRDANGVVIFQASIDTHSVYMNGSVQIGGGQSLNQAIAAAVTDANAYADDILGDYSEYVSDRFDVIEGRLDGQVETWYYPYEPTLNNAPASSWDTEAKKLNHQGDTFTNTNTGISYRFIYESGVWQWKVIPDTIATQALQAAAAAQDTADHKRRVFYQQPYPPYDLGDLWVEGASGDIWRCAVQKADGTSFASTDWVLASKYTDDSSFNSFVNGDYSRTINAIQSQLDGKAETWYQATDPAIEWETTGVPWLDHNGEAFLDHELEEIYTAYPQEAERHEGDLWKRTTDNKEFIFQNGEWVEMQVPDEVFDEIDGKAQIFGVQPYTPYHVGDLWFTGDEIKYCQTERLTGNYTATDWIRKEGYTDDSAFNAWLEDDLPDIVQELQEQSDQKAETWYQNTDPSSAWDTPEKKALHAGDLWYCTADIAGTSYKQGTTWHWNGSLWQQQNVPAAVFDEIDGKAQIFVNQPVPPYHVGDLWFNSTTSDIMTCITQRLTGNYNSEDWQKRNKYTDDSSLTTFVDTVYASQIENFQRQIDGKVETWYQSTDPSIEWGLPVNDNWIDSTDDEFLDHEGEPIVLLWEKNKYYHEGDFWHKTTDNTEWLLKDGMWQAMDVPDELFDMVDGKASIFTTTPTVPYNKDDMWFTGDEILVSNVTRSTGDSFNRSDWVKKDFYTDDSTFNTWKNGVYKDTIEELEEQMDKKAETWYQGTNPASAWTTPELKALHKGDLWYCTANIDATYQTGTTWYWNGSAWQQQNIPQTVFDEIDGKAQIFVTQPTHPYYKNDLWFDGSVIKVCIHDSSSGYDPNHWARKEGYTDDSAFNTWKNGAYKDTIEALTEQTDKKAETWYQNTNPAASWTTPALKAEHKGDLWYCTADISGTSYKQGTTWYWNGSTWQQQNVPAEVFDEIDGKAQIFVSQPNGPYSVGDLWFNSSSSDIMTCVTARTTSGFNQNDWQKRNKYTDDSALNLFINGAFADLVDSNDDKIETWYQGTDPSNTWTTTALKNEHKGDIWQNSSTQKSYRWSGTAWQEMTTTPPSEVMDTIDGKAQIWRSQPTPPYRENDLWTQGSTGDILTCVNTRLSGNYVSTDWQKRNKYTDDSTFNTWKTTYEPVINGYQSQIDGKIESYNQTADPSTSWSAADKQKHVGDLWYNPTDKVTKRYTLSSGSYSWVKMEDADALAADSLAKAKRRVFTAQPTPPYDVGDLWWTSTTDGSATIKMAKTARTSSQSYSSNDWVEPKYVDEDDVSNAIDTYDQTLDFEEVLNRLTENGSQRVLYYNQNLNLLLIDADYIRAGTLAGERINGKGLHITDNNNVTTLYVDSDGNVLLNVTSLQISSKNIAKYVAEKSPEVANLLESPIALSTDFWDIYGTLSSGYSDPEGGNSASRLQAVTNVDSYCSAKPSTNKPLKVKNTTYRFSVWLKTSGSAKDIIISINHSLGIIKTVHVTTAWQQFSIDYDLGNDVTTGNQVTIGGFGSFTSGYLYIYKPEVVYTDPYMDQDLLMDRLTNGGVEQGIYQKNGKVYINGQYIKVASIAADKLSVIDLYAIGATVGGFTIDSTSIYARGHKQNQNDVKYIEIKTQSLYDGKSGSIAIRRDDGAGILMESGKIHSSTSDLRLYLTPGAWIRGDVGTIAEENSLGRTSFYGDVYTDTGVNFTCRGTKSAARNTEHYGEQTYYCYETPTPIFGDIGDGVLDDTGTCLISIDEIMQEATRTDIQYFVFLQKCGRGDCWVEDRQPGYFVVKGTPGLAFSWELKAKQTGYEHIRYNDGERETRWTDFEMPAYADMYADLLSSYEEEMEDNLYG